MFKSFSRIINEKNGLYITPKSVQDTIPIKKIFDDGSFLTGSTYTKTIKFDDINYSDISLSDKEKIFLNQEQLINIFEDNTYTQLTIFNRQIDKKALSEKYRIKEKGEWQDEYRKEMNNYLQTNIVGNGAATQQEKYITLSINVKEQYEAQSYFNRMEGIFASAFETVNSEMHVLNIEERLKLLYDFYNAGTTNEFNFHMKDVLRKGSSFKDHIVPDSFEFKRDYFIMGEKYGRVLFLKNYASYIKDEMINYICGRNKTMMLSATLNPMPIDKAIKMASSKVLGKETEKATWQRRQNANNNYSAAPPYELEKQIEEMNDLLNDLHGRDQKLIMTTITIVHLADSKEQLDSDSKEIIKAGDRYACTIAPLAFQQLEGLNTVLPYAQRFIQVQRTFTTESATAVSMPYSGKKIQHEKGVYFGQNPVNKAPILIDRKELKNANAFFVGSAGGGKSFKAKQEALQVFFTADDTDIILVDPDNEYTHIVQALGGNVYSFSAGTQSYVNPLDINAYYNSDENGNFSDPVTLKSDLVTSIFEAIIGKGKLTAVDRSIIDRCLHIVLDPYIINNYEGICPTLGDLSDVLTKQPEAEAKSLVISLELFTKGSLNIFNHQTNIDTNNRLSSFEYSAVGTSLKAVATLVALDFIQNKITTNMKKKRTTFVVYDEVSYIYEHELAGEFLQMQFRRGRKYGAQLTGMTQNISNVLASPTASIMLANSEMLVVFGQNGDDIKNVKELLKLSDDETKYISNTRKGGGLIKIGKSYIPFEDSFPNNTKLYQLMSTKPNERLV